MDTTGPADSGSPTPSWRPEDDGLTVPYVDLRGLVSERLGGVAAWLRARPLVAAAVLVVPLGAVFGLLLARRRGRAPAEALDAPVHRVGARAQRTTRGARKRLKGRRPGQLAYVGDLFSIGLRLWKNPLVRALVLQLLTRRFAHRLI